MKSVILIICFLLLSKPISARTWYIKSDHTGDAPTIEAAIDSASVGDTILVAPGIYIENELLIEKDLYLLSEQGPLVTTIKMYHDPDIFKNNSVIEASSLSSNSEISGFTLRDGAGVPIEGGGGINLINSSTLVRDNIIHKNSTMSGGGIACIGESPVIRRNIIFHNGAGEGNGIIVGYSMAIIDSNTICFNGIEGTGVTHGGLGGGIAILTDHPVTIRNNIIAYNNDYNPSGGGVYCYDAPDNIIFECNLVYGNAPNDYGGAISDQTGINGNISVDPQFCAARPDSTMNFYLQSDSPCLPTNYPACGLIGAMLQGCGEVGVKEVDWSEIKSLFK